MQPSTRLALWAIGYGLLIWFEATIIIRWAGDLIFVPDNLAWTIATFMVSVVIVFLVGWTFFATFQTPPSARMGAAVLIVAVGLVAETFVFLRIEGVFPDMTLAQQREFAAWVVWSYGLGLLSALWPRLLWRVPS